MKKFIVKTQHIVDTDNAIELFVPHASVVETSEHTFLRTSIPFNELNKLVKECGMPFDLECNENKEICSSVYHFVAESQMMPSSRRSARINGVNIKFLPLKAVYSKECVINLDK